MDDVNETKRAENVGYLFHSGLGDSAQLVLMDIVSQSETLKNDQDISNMVEGVAFSSSDLELKAAALSAVVPTYANKNRLLSEVKGVLLSENSSAISFAMRTFEQVIYSSDALMSHADKLDLKKTIMSIANNQAENVDNRIKALSLSAQL